MPLKNVAGLEVLELEGTSKQMGAEHGALFGERIRLVVAGFLQKSEEIFNTPCAVIRSEARRCEPFISPEYIEEMQGLAEASGVPYEDVLALNCLVDVDACHTQPMLRCCNFVLGPPVTQDGLFIHGRNIDFPPGGVLPQAAMVVVRKPADGMRLATMAVGWAGFVGLLTGCSASQLTCAEVGMPATDCCIEGLPIGFVLRHALEQSDGLEEFAEVIRATPRTAGFNIAVCDGKKGDCRAVEFTRETFGVRKARGGVLVVDNVCLCPETARNRLTYASGVFRYARVMNLVESYRGRIDVDLALTFLKDRYDLARGTAQGVGYNCICNKHTVHSVLFLPSMNAAHVAHGEVPAPTGSYHEIDLGQLFNGESGGRSGTTEMSPGTARENP